MGRLKARICGKVSDCGFYAVIDEDGNVVHDTQGYVPSWLFGGGDYLEFDVDLETGQILNWEPPTAEQIEQWKNETKRLVY